MTIFTALEFEMLLNGLSFINVDDWETNAVYKGGYIAGHKILNGFGKYYTNST